MMENESMVRDPVEATLFILGMLFLVATLALVACAIFL